MKRKPFYRHLYFWVLIGMAAGIVVGWLFPASNAAKGKFSATSLQFFSTAFIGLLRMIIAPVIFAMVVVGWVVAKLVQPGAGMNIDPSQLDVRELQPTLNRVHTQDGGIAEVILHIIPKTLVGAFAEGDILQVLLISVLFGIAMSGLGEANRPIINALEQVAKALMRMITMIIKLAPLAVFGA